MHGPNADNPSSQDPSMDILDLDQDSVFPLPAVTGVSDQAVHAEGAEHGRRG